MNGPSPQCAVLSFLCLSDVVLQPSEYFDLGHEISEVNRRVDRQFLPKSLPRSQLKLVARHGQLLGALLDLVVRLLVTLAIVPNHLILALSEHQERANAFRCFRINHELSYE